MTRTRLLTTALLVALLSSVGTAAYAGPLPQPIPPTPSQGYIPEAPPIGLPVPGRPLLPRFDPKFPAVPWLPTLPSNRKDHPIPLPLPPEFYTPTVPAPVTLVLPTCAQLLPDAADGFLAEQHLDVAPTTIEGRHGIADPELVALLTARDHISCTWTSTTTKGSLTISIALLHEPADSATLLSRLTALGYSGSHATGFGLSTDHAQQYDLIPLSTGPTIARLPFWIAVLDETGAPGLAQPYALLADDAFFALNGVIP